MSARFAGLFAAILLATIPIASAVPSGLTYLDSTWSSLDGEGGEIIAMNPNSTILASYHGKEIILFNTSTLERIAAFTFDEDVSAMEFNPNGSMLAINKRSTVQLEETIRLIDIHNLEVLEYSVEADELFRDIAWSIDGSLLAAQGKNGDIEQYNIPTLSKKNTLALVHVVDVTCIDYRSDGQYILTGDESGRWAIWNLEGQMQGPAREFGQGIIDCKFDPDGSDIVLLGEDGNLTSEEYGGSEKKSVFVEGGKEILFSKNGNRMHVSIERPGFNGLNSYDYTTFNEIQNTSFFHRVNEIEFIEDDYSRIQSLFVAASTGEIAVYLRELIPEGYGLAGADLDGDNVPDNIDSDDDGDGIIDDWDDDFGCDAPEGTPCSRYPDLDKIRNIEITIGDEFIIRDQITLPTEDSSNIRNLSRNSIAKDQVISASETQFFADAICQNMDKDDIIFQLRDTIEISSGELGEAVVECSVISGMELVRDGDSTTQITIAITTRFQYQTMVTLPLDINLKEQTLPTDGSIAWLAPAHPVSLTFKGEGVETKTIPLWWNDGENPASITITQISVKNPSSVEKLVSWLTNPLAFILYFGILAGAITLLLRRKNTIDFNLDEDEDIEEDNESDIDDVSVENQSNPQYNRDVDKKKNIEDSVKRRRPSRSATRPKKRSFELNDNVATVKKRKVATGNLNKEGPIMKTKRKRLVSNPDVENADSVSVENKVKTRKVKTKVESPKPTIRKRKSVKAKEQNNDEKIIDEEKLQGSLVDDFTSED